MTKPKPSPQQIEIRAYEIFLIRGCQDGHADEDWLAAERELQQEFESDLAEDAGTEQSLSEEEPEAAPKTRAAAASQRPSTSSSSTTT